MNISNIKTMNFSDLEIGSLFVLTEYEDQAVFAIKGKDANGEVEDYVIYLSGENSFNGQPCHDDNLVVTKIKKFAFQVDINSLRSGSCENPTPGEIFNAADEMLLMFSRNRMGHSGWVNLHTGKIISHYEMNKMNKVKRWELISPSTNQSDSIQEPLVRFSQST